MFSFGFGKKKAEAEEAALAEEKAREAAEAEEKARQEAAAKASEQAAAEEKARKEKEALAKAEVERHAAEQAAIEAERKSAEAKRKAEEEAQAAREAEAEARKLAEEKAAAEEQARKLAEEEAAKEKERQEAAATKAKQEAEEKHKQEAAELAKAEEQARLAAEEEERAKQAVAKAAPAPADDMAPAPPDDVALAGNDEQQGQPDLSGTPATGTAQPVIDDDVSGQQENERRQSWFLRLRKGLSRSSSALGENITSVFTKKRLDEDTLQDLEDILIQADLGVETAMNVTDALASQRMGKDVTDEEVRLVMAQEIAQVLEPVAQPLELDLEHQPHVILVVGVNGSGKTTTIGKISQKLYDAGFSTLLVAGDTFRAAAIEQLHIWGERTQAPVMSREHGADAAGLAYDAYLEAKEQRRDVMLMDTAGRLQNRKELMDELEKIIRVLKKHDPAAPHTVLLTLDATTGQNALNQVEIFKDVAGVNGLVMTKLDGTARGGILVSIAARHKLPVYFLGVGEQVEDLEPFEAEMFARSIAGLE